MARSANTAQVVSYWLIGREIVEEEQRGSRRAEYGKRLLLKLSERMTEEFGRGYSVQNLWYVRQLHLTYPDLIDGSKILHAVRGEFRPGDLATGCLNPNLSRTHYRTLLRVRSIAARSFYETETAKRCWSARELERQINTLLYERVARTQDKETLMQSATAGYAVHRPVDTLRDPFVMGFMGLTDFSRLAERELEDAIVSHMDEFLKEMGDGFSYVSRQQRITIDGDHFYVDLVLYHTILRCNVLVELKCGKFEPRDLGQLQFYVNYYDEERRRPDENPTLGLLLCADKNNAVVRYTVGKENSRLFASKYLTHLPTEVQLQERIRRAASLRR